MTQYKRMTALHRFTFKIARQASRVVAEKLTKSERENLKLYKFIFFLIVKSLSIFFYYPIKSYIVSREWRSLLPIEIIFVDQSELSGFLIANLIMSMLGWYLVFVSLFGSLHFYNIISNYAIQVDLIEADVMQLDAFWSDTSTTSLSERHLFLRNICQKCQDKDK